MKMWPHANATLVALMKQKGLGPTRLAARVPATAGMISHLRTGTCKSCNDTLARAIVRELGVPLEVLFDPSTETDSSANRDQGAA